MSAKLPEPIFENLEPRLMLTTLMGGDTFEYWVEPDILVRVVLEGDIIAEFIGSNVDTIESTPFNQVIRVGDLPGQIAQSDLGRAGSYVGGLGGLDGLELIGPTPVTEPTNFDADNTNFNALASRDAAIGAGQTFGFNTGTTNFNGGDHVFVQLAQLDNATGTPTIAAYLQQATLGQGLGSESDAVPLSGASLAGVSDIAVDPITGLGYGLANNHLYSINLTSGLVVDLGVINNTTDTRDMTGVMSIAFDTTGQLWILTNNAAAVTDIVSLVKLDKATAAFVDGDATDLPTGGSNYTGLAINPITNDIFGVSQTIADETATYNLHYLGTTAAPGFREDRGAIEAAVIVSLSYAEDLFGNQILIGMDHSQVDDESGNVLARLVRITELPAAITPLSSAGMVSTLDAISSYAVAGRPLLFGTDGVILYRGSSASLPTSDTGLSLIESVSGASFRPFTGDVNDGLLYFTVKLSGDGALSALYTIDVASGSIVEVQNSLNFIGDFVPGTEDVTTLTWDKTPDGSGGTAVTLYGFMTVSDGVNSLVTIDPLTAVFSNPVAVTLLNNAITDITAISLPGDDPTKSFVLGEERMVAVSGAELIEINDAGLVYVLGPLQDVIGPDGEVHDERGNDIQGMAWNPILRNPFTGSVGVLIGTDATTDELLFIDARARGLGEIFAIYISQASANANIAISYVDATTNLMIPFVGNAGPMRINPAQGGDTILISPEDGTGGFYLGIRTIDYDNVEDEEAIPFLFDNIVGPFGVRAAGVDDLLSDVDHNLSTGVVLAENLLDFFAAAPDFVDKLLGQNLDDVQGLAVDMQGNVVVVDTDNLDETGNPIIGDQIATVAANGRADLPLEITDAVTGIPLAGIQGLDFGDVDFLGIEDLYGVLNVNDVRPITNIGTDLGADMNFVGMSVTLGGQMYAVNDNAGTFELHRIDRDGTGVTVVTLMGTVDAILPASVLGAMAGVPAVAGSYTVTEIAALEANEDGNLFAVGLVNFGGTEGVQQALLEISFATGSGTVIGLLDETVLVAGSTTQALALDMDSDILYAVVEVAGVDTLYTLDTSAATPEQIATVVGAVEVVGVPTNIDSGDFMQAGIFLVIDKSGGAGQTKMVRVNLTDPLTSVETSVPGSVNDDLTNYAFDSDGFAYSIFDDNAANNQVWVSPGIAPTLGTLDTITGAFTAIGPIGAGAGIVSAIAFSPGEGSIPGQQGLYLVGNGSLLFEINPKSGALLSPGDTLTFDDEGTPVTIGITSMNFDGLGNLYGQDMANGRVVDINLIGLGTGTIPVGAIVATTIGSLRPTVGGIAYDFSQKKFLAVDNAPGLLLLGDENATPDVGAPAEFESAALMTLKAPDENIALGSQNDILLDQQMGKIMIAGTVTGRVHINGSIDRFYAGWLITGNAKGRGEGSSPLSDPQVTDNFLVDGDIRDLIVKGAIGTLDDSGLDVPIYLTGFDMEVVGRAGQIWTSNSFLGALNVQNLEDIINMDASIVQGEIEYRTDDDDANIEGIMFDRSGSQGDNFRLYALDGTFFNDTFETAQYLGTVRSTTAGGADEINVHGELFNEATNPDDSDFYAVSLLAGQTVTVTLTSPSFLLERMKVYDPDGRLIATNGEFFDFNSATNMPFRFTADRPGAYRFEVTTTANHLTRLGRFAYDFTIANVGDVALGGVIAARNSDDRTGNNIFSYVGNTVQFNVERGDLGAIFAGDLFFSEAFNDDIQVGGGGNLRSVVAQQFGQLDGVAVEDMVRINVSGTAGLLRTTAATGVLGMWQITVGGDLQLVDAADLLHLRLWAGGGLGVLRAGHMTLNRASVINLNVDGIGNDGILDLIDITGNMGMISVGGPQIDTGPGGNVRYIRVGGNVFQDIFFGGGGQERTTLNPDQSVQFRDDSGGLITLAPMPTSFYIGSGQAVDPVTFLPLDDEDLPFLSYRTYGIRGGGVALIDVISSGSINIAANSNGLGNAVEIGLIQVDGIGRNVLRNDDGTLEMEAYANTYAYTDLTVNILGSSNNPIDVFEIIGGNFTVIRNETGGEIVNVTATTIGAIKSRGDVGLPKNLATPTAVNPINILPDGDLFPFIQQHVGIVSGHIIRILARGSIGNVIVTGSINEIQANYNDPVNHTDGKFDGINGPILALGAAGVGGDINFVRIGEGIAPSGTGDVSYGGLYAQGWIGKVVNQGLGSDIRGTINGERGIGQILLDDGSIIQALIGTILIEDARITDDVGDDDDFNDGTISGFPVARVYLTGVGGIVGSLLRAHSFGNIAVNGYGIFNSEVKFDFGAMSTASNITVAGYGIRDVFIRGGASMGNITATGRGARVSTLMYPYTVRYSETETWNPLTGQLITRLNDIHRFLSTSMAAPNDVQGLIDRVDADGGQNLGIISGYQVSNSSFDFASKIGGLRTYRLVAPDTLAINNVEITTGKIGIFYPLGDVSGLTMNISGVIRSLYIGADLLGGSVINASGPNGNIVYLRIRGDMVGTINATGTIGKVIIGGDMTGNITAEVTGSGRYALSYLKIGGSFTGSLDLNGNVGTIIIGDNLGSLGGPVGASLQINGNLNKLYVGNSRTVNGSRLILNVNVVGNLGTLYVIGQIDGDIYVGGTMNKLLAYADAVTAGTSLINGNVTVLESIRVISIRNGDFGDGATVQTLTAGGDIVSFTITNGDLAAFATITSAFGDIRKFKISNGDLLGAVTAINGTIWSLRVLGSDLGANSSITADTINRLYVQGSVLAGAAITVDKSVNTFYVGQHVLGDVQIGSSRSVTVKGNLQGNLTLGYYYRVTSLYVGGNMGVPAATNPGEMTVSIDADAKITVLGNILAGTALSIGRDLKSMNVTGTIAGDVYVEGATGTLKANAITNAVLTTGLDMKYLYVLGNMINTLVQTGIRRGGDNDFATVDVDGSDDGRMGKLTKLLISGTATNSIISAGGDVNSALIMGGMVNSSVSSGFVLGGSAIAGVINDAGGFAARLSDAARRNTARSDGARTLLRGNFKTAQVRGTGMTGSYLSAGVDPGADGIFGTGDDNVVNSVTGGNSSFRSVKATMDAGSRVVSDNGITRNSTTGGIVTPNVTYAITDITTNKALEALVGTAVSGTPVTINGVTVTVTGLGQVALYNDAGDSNVDTLVISGTNTRTRIVVTGAGTTIGRILTTDDTQFYSLTYEGTLAGDGTDDPDLWLDSPVRIFTLGTLGDAVNGRIGGDVTLMNINMQGSGNLRIGGKVTLMNIIGSIGDPLLNLVPGVAPSTDISIMTTDSTGSGTSWVFDEVTGNLSEVTLASGAVVTGPFAVSESFSGAALLSLRGMDFDGLDILSGIASLYNQSPTMKIGSISNTSLSLHGLAIDVNGRAVAIETSELVALNGDLGGEFDIQAITVTNGGDMYAVNNNAGVLELYRIERNASGDVTGFALIGNIVDDASAAITDINSMDVDAAGNLLVVGSTTGGTDMTMFRINSVTGIATAAGVALTDPGAVNDSITGIIWAQSGETLYMVRDIAGVDTLYTVSAAGVMTEVAGATLGTGAIQVNGVAVNIIEMDVDLSGKIFAIGTAAGGNQTFRINLLDPAKSWELSDPGSVSADAKGYTSDANGAFYTVQDTASTNDTVLRSWGGDRLVEINTTTGIRTVVGTINDTFTNAYYSDVLALAFGGNAGSIKLYALVSDRDGVGGAYTSDNGVAIIQIELTDGNGDGIVWASHPNNTFQPGVFLDQGDNDTLVNAVLGAGVVRFTTTAAHADWAVGDAVQNDTGNGNDWVGRITNVVDPSTFDVRLSKGTFAASVNVADGIERNVADAFNAMSLDAAGNIYAIRRGTGTFANQDHLVKIALGAGTVGDTDMLAAGTRVQVGGAGDTEIIGMGFDEFGNIIAYNHDTPNLEAELIGLTAANLTTPNAAQLITNAGALGIEIDGFALGRSGANFLTYAFDTDNAQINLNGDLDYGQFFMNPGTVDTLGSINTATGVFTQWIGLAQDANGTTLSSPVVDMSFNTVTGNLFVVTADGRLAEYLPNGRLEFQTQTDFGVLSAGSVIDNDHSVVTITTDNPQINWQVGDYLGNGIGTFDDWFGQITTRINDTTFQITLSKGAFADIDIADDVALGNSLPRVATITSVETGDSLDVTAIDFNGSEMIGTDARFNQLVTIDDFQPLVDGLRAATAQARTENGAVDVANLAGLTYDPTGGTFYAFRESDDRFIQFRGTTQLALGGIVAGSISKLVITGPGQSFNGRIVTMGNTFGSVTIVGNFTGSLISGGDINRFIQTGGDFSGRLLAAENIKYVNIIGEFLDGGSVEATAILGTLIVSGANNDFGGLVKAQRATTISVSGAGLTTADLLIYGNVSNIGFSGAFSGVINIGSATSLRISGQATATADIDINGNAKSISLLGGTAAGSSLITQGYVSRLSIGGQHSGLVGIRRGMGSASVLTINAGLLAVGEKTSSLRVTGTVIDSVISFGTWVGADGLYNTADDIITGGGVKSVSIGGNFYDSAVVAGVLPSMNTASVGVNNIPTDMKAYVGNTAAANYMDINPAEHGGILGSSIKLLKVTGWTVSPFGATKSVAAAANTINRVILRTPGQSILTREYIDPIGAPSVVSSKIINDMYAKIVFSEELNTSSLVLSQDIDGDGAITPGGSDIVGTVLITDETGKIINDIILSYSTQTTDSGRVQSVLTFYKTTGFDGVMVIVDLSSLTALPSSVIYGSSLRSARMSLNSLPVANILTSQPPLPFPFGDVAGNFLDALNLPEFKILLNKSLTTGNAFDGDDDTDVFRFTANTFEFFSIQYSSNVRGQLSLFYQDTQGTAILSDDTFELVARDEDNVFDLSSPYTLFEAFELAGTGDYFILVNPAPGETISEGNNIYTLELNRASSDSNLINQLGGTLPVGEEIAYVSNFVGQNNNLVGANDPRQLVYLNFDGGTATKFNSEGLVDILPFDVGDIEAGLAGNDTRIIEGGSGVVGIVDNVLSIFSNIAGGYRNELGDYEIDTLVSAVDLGGGRVEFTTTNPHTWIEGDSLQNDIGDGNHWVGQIDAPPVGNTFQVILSEGTFGTVDVGEGIQWIDHLTVKRITSLAEWTSANQNQGGLYFTTIDPATWGLDPETDFTTAFTGNADDILFGGGLLGIANLDLAGQSEADNAIIFSQNFTGLPVTGSEANRLNQYSIALATVIGHELGHTFGLNHQPTSRDADAWMLIADDPSNNFDPDNPKTANLGNGLMAYSSNEVLVTVLGELGTNLTSDEIPEIGQIHIDTQNMIMTWFS